MKFRNVKNEEAVLRAFVREHLGTLTEAGSSYEELSSKIDDFFSSTSGTKSGQKSATVPAADDKKREEEKTQKEKKEEEEKKKVDMGKDLGSTGSGDRMAKKIGNLSSIKSDTQLLTKDTDLSSFLQDVIPAVAPKVNQRNVQKAVRTLNTTLSQVKPEEEK